MGLTVDTALALNDLAPSRSHEIYLTLPREQRPRTRQSRASAKLHTTTVPLGRDENRDYSESSAERVLPRASNLWVQSSLAQKQRLQQVFFPDGIRFDEKKLVGTGTTPPVFNYLNPIWEAEKDLVDLMSASSNPLTS